MEKDFLVFWQREGYVTQAQVVRVAHPPHDEPRGTVLHDLVLDAVDNFVEPVTLHGIVELPAAQWSPGAYRELTTAGGRIGALECSGNEWRVVL